MTNFGTNGSAHCQTDNVLRLTCIALLAMQRTAEALLLFTAAATAAMTADAHDTPDRCFDTSTSAAIEAVLLSTSSACA